MDDPRKVRVTWHDEFHKSIDVLDVDKGTVVVYHIGDFVWYKERGNENAGVLLANLIGDDDGPIGFTYLPWRDHKQCWGTPVMSLRGDPRFIICYPYGLGKYGVHIDWLTLRKAEPVDHPEFRNKNVGWLSKE
jgi:hypothetical protein